MESNAGTFLSVSGVHDVQLLMHGVTIETVQVLQMLMHGYTCGAVCRAGREECSSGDRGTGNQGDAQCWFPTAVCS